MRTTKAAGWIGACVLPLAIGAFAGCGDAPEPSRSSAKMVLERFPSLESKTTGVDEWDVGNVSVGADRFTVARGFSLARGRTPLVEIVSDPSGTTHARALPERRPIRDAAKTRALARDLEAMSTALQGMQRQNEAAAARQRALRPLADTQPCTPAEGELVATCTPPLIGCSAELTRAASATKGVAQALESTPATSSDGAAAPPASASLEEGTDAIDRSCVRAPDVIVLTQDESDRAVVGDDGVDLPVLSAEHRERIKPGAVVIGRRGKSTDNQHGFLRQVRTVPSADLSQQDNHTGAGSGAVIGTAPARLRDAIETGEVLAVSEAVDPYSPPSFEDDNTAETSETERRRYEHSFPPREIFSNQNLVARLDAVRTTCTPKFDTALTMDGFTPTHVRFVMDDRMTMTATVSAEARGRMAHSVSYPLFKNKILLPTVMIGPIPLVQTIDVSVDVSCDFSAEGSVTTRAGVEVAFDYRFGAEYDGSDWQMVAEAGRLGFTPITPTVTGNVSATADCRLVPRVALLFYDVIGPYVSVTPRVVANARAGFANATRPTAGWSLTASIRADAGLTGEISIPGMRRINTLINDQIRGAQFTLFQREQSWQGELTL